MLFVCTFLRTRLLVLGRIWQAGVAEGLGQQVAPELTLLQYRTPIVPEKFFGAAVVVLVSAEPVATGASAEKNPAADQGFWDQRYSKSEESVFGQNQRRKVADRQKVLPGSSRFQH